MNYPEVVKDMIGKFGQSVSVRRDGAHLLDCHAVMMPLLYKNKLYVELKPSTVGQIDEGCYRFLAPYDVALKPDDIVSMMGKSFVTERCELIYLSGEPFYSWAILRPCVN